MAFESLSERLSQAMKNITGQGKLTEKNMNDMLKEVRMSLLEADVNYGVVKDFVASVKEMALGQEVMESLNPSQMVVKIVRDELQELLGSSDTELTMNPSGITTVMMTGLQGTGKTTASGKIARYARQKLKKNVLLVAADVVRPAAIEQLQTLGAQVGVDVFSLGPDVSAVETARQALVYAKEHGHDLVILDTAGRLHVDQALMDELLEMKGLVQPDNILLTVDAMTGQDIVNVARAFDEQLDVTGLVVTKMDGDARGGGLLSVRSITSVPVVFVSGGEKMEDLEQFHPDRMADRILGMGDVVSLIEQAQDRLDMEVGKKSADRMMNGIFTFNDMLAQFGQLEKMGSMQGILKMIPGLNKMAAQVNDEAMNSVMKRNRAIIQSMTPFEREHPACLKASRKQRIAKGSGVKVQDVNKLIQQLNQMQQMTKMMSGGMNMNSMMNAMGRGQGVSKHTGSKKQKVSKKKKKKK
ncbi:signal recognition particle protein [uncultured Faecalibaculum sp.]|uniref:signal recognition particle protein n=1 Tax=uncultured Faecalibaculum sp. TaxID=1729681 RepID=UPI002676BF5D|nr:signal recognition particle protein [uncultured Faecalibaculum sp.]